MLRAKGLHCLVSILKCMVEWSRDYYIDPATTGLHAVRIFRGDPGGTSVGAVEEIEVAPDVNGTGMRSSRVNSLTVRQIGATLTDGG